MTPLQRHILDCDRCQVQHKHELIFDALARARLRPLDEGTARRQLGQVLGRDYRLGGVW